MKKLLPIVALLFAITANGQAVGDYLFQRKAAVGFAVQYLTPSGTSLLSWNGSGQLTNTAQSTFATAAHTHTFVSLTSKPTTVAGYGITDFNSLGDARWSLLGHVHAGSDITSGTIGTARLGTGTANNTTFLRGDGTWATPSGGGSGDVVGPASSTDNNVPQWDGATGKLMKNGLGTSTGGNQTADAGKLLTFRASGSIGATADGTVSTSALSAAIIGGPSTNAAIEGQAFDAFAARLVNESTTRPALEAENDDATKVGPIAHFQNIDGLGVDVVNDGGLDWTSATGAATTRTNLGLGTLATQSGTFSGTSSGTNTGDQTNISGNAATVTTNANLTGPVTSVGNATSIANGAISNAMLANGAVANLSGTNTGDQTSVTGNAGTATALQTARNINGVAFDGTANISITEHHAPFLVRAATPFPYNNLPAAANFFQDAAPPNVFPCDLTHATQARIYVYTATTGSAGSKLSIRYKTGAWSSTAGDYADIGTSEVAATVAAANTFTDSGWVNLAAGAKAEIYMSVFGLGGNGVADPTFNILGVQFR